jgi:hypothetical protein
MPSEFHASYEGIGEMLRMPEILANLRERMQRAKDLAEERSPVGDPRRDPHAGQYKESWYIEETLHGGARHDRAQVILGNSSPQAVYNEYGNRNTPARHIAWNAVIEGARDT